MFNNILENTNKYGRPSKKLVRSSNEKHNLNSNIYHECIVVVEWTRNYSDFFHF